MSKISPILRFELRRGITRSHAWIAVTLIVTSLVIFQLGIGKYQGNTRMMPGFIEIEHTKIKQFQSYTQYLKSGFRILPEPSPLVALFHNSTAFGDLVGLIGNGTGLTVSSPQVGGNVFARPTGGILDLSWYLLIIGGILFLYFGFSTFGPGNRDLIKYLLSFAGPGSVYTGILLGRILLLSFVLGITVILLWLQLFINGITLSSAETGHLLIFFGILEIAMCLLFILGAVLGTAKNRMKGGLAAVVLWLGLLLLWPEALNSLFSRDASAMKPIFEQEAKKLKVLVDFERKVFNNIKEYKTPDERNRALREMSDHYLNNEFKEIEKLEADMIERVARLADRFHFWSMFNPATLYRAVGNELSSRGYNSYIAFSKELQGVQRGFLAYTYNKRFFERDPVVKPYLKGEEYIFKLESSLPGYFWAGVLLNLFYIALVFWAGYFRFKRVVFPKPEITGAFESLNLELVGGKHFSYGVPNKDFVNQLFNVLSGRARKFGGKVTIDGGSIVGPEKKDFVYIPGPEVIPDEIKSCHLLAMAADALGLPKEEKKQLKAEVGNKSLAELEPGERARLLIKTSGLKKHKIYLIDHISLASGKELDTIFADLEKDDDSLIVEITTGSPIHSSFDRYYRIFLFDAVYKEHLLEKEKR